MVLAYPQTMLIDHEGNEIGPFDDRLDLRSPSAARRLRDYAMRWRLANALFGVVRAATLARTHLVQPYVSSDLTLIAELALRGEFHEVPERLFLRRIHPDSSRQGTLSLDAVATWFIRRAARCPSCRRSSGCGPRRSGPSPSPMTCRWPSERCARASTPRAGSRSAPGAGWDGCAATGDAPVPLAPRT